VEALACKPFTVRGVDGKPSTPRGIPWGSSVLNVLFSLTELSCHRGLLVVGYL